MATLEHAEVTPRTTGLDRVSAAFAGEPVEFFDRDPAYDAVHQNCYWNVEREVDRHGGKIVFGWYIIEIPRIFFLCWHHAVWQNPEGKLIDRSPVALNDYSRGLTAFVRDSRQEYDLNWPPAIPQRFIPLLSDPRISNFIECYQQLHTLKAEALKLQRALPGAKFDPHSGTIEGSPAIQTALRLLQNQWAPKIAEREVLLQEARQALIGLQREVSPMRSAKVD